MPTIDVHTHAFPDAIAERAIEKLEAECPWKAVGSGTVEALVRTMDAAGVDLAVPCAIATKPGQAGGILQWCRAIASDRLVPFPSVHPDTPDAPDWVARIAEAGFPGLKLHPMYQEFAIDEPRLDGIYAACAECGLPIAFHSGRDIAYPPDDDRADPERLARVLDRHEGLKVISTHMGGWRMWDEADQAVVGRENVYLETSFSLVEPPAERIAAMIRRHGVERVMFGSDWPWCDPADDLRRLDALGLTADELAAVRGDNAARLLGLAG